MATLIPIMATPIPTNFASFTLAEVAEATGGSLHGDAERVVCGVFTDSRTGSTEGLFVALVGESFDAHRFASSVTAAAVLVSDSDSAQGRAHVLVPDTLEALGALAQFHRIRWGGALVAITGSVGKTTTKELVRTAIEGMGRAVCATQGNLNNLVGLPMSLLALTDAHEVGVFELGSSGPGEIEALGAMALPDVAVITAVCAAHTEGLGTLEDVAREKLSLLSFLDEEDHAVLCADDPFLTRPDTDAEVLRFGVSSEADVRITSRALTAQALTARASTSAEQGYRLHIELEYEGGRSELNLRQLGRGSSLGAAAAFAVIRCLSKNRAVSDEMFAAARALDEAIPVPGRMAPYHSDTGVLVVDDTYNASPASMAAALRDVAELAGLRGGRCVAVLGDMLELGAIEEQAHDAVLRRAAEYGFKLIVVGAAMQQAAIRQPVYGSFASVSKISEAEIARLALGPHDVLLAKGSRSMGMEYVVQLALKSLNTEGAGASE